MRIDDYIHLGSAVPEQTKSHGITVCSAGYSLELRSLIRIYPTAMTDRLRRWRTYELDLRRNPKDSRRESWRLEDDRLPLECACLGERGLEQRWADVERFVVPSIDYLNRHKRSLGIIAPRSMPRLFFVDNPDRAPLFEQRHLNLPDFDPPVGPGRHVFEYWPYLEFDDEDGRHQTSLLDWGAYEYLRKRGDRPMHHLRDAYGMHRGAVRLLVGNINRHRNVFIVIAILVLPEQRQFGLFPADAPVAETPA